jgi:hypothetical protein
MKKKMWGAELLLVAVMMGCFIAPMFWFGIPIFGWYFAGSMVLLLVFEGLALVTTYIKDKEAKTLSRLFIEASRTRKAKATLTLGFLSAGWFILIWHLSEGIREP